MVPGDDRPCANCGGFHANPMSRNRTHWTTCVAEWDLVCQKSSEAYMELQRQRAGRAKQATTIGHVATHIDGAPVILDYSPAEMAMAHATVLASRVPRQPAAYAAPPTAPATLDVNYAGMHQVQGQPDIRRFESYGQRPNTDTDYPGFSVPWNHYNSYMMCVEESEGPTDPTMPHLLTSFGTTYEDVLTTRTQRRVLSLSQPRSMSRVLLAKHHIVHGPPAAGSVYGRATKLLHTERYGSNATLFRELVHLVDNMPPTDRNGRRVWPFTPDERDDSMWKDRQAELHHVRHHGVPRPIPWGHDSGAAHVSNAIHYSQHPAGMRAEGVPGVTYPQLPWNSGHKDPNHSYTGDYALVAWMKDSGAGVPGFKDAYGLGDIYRLDRSVVIGGIVNATNLTVTTGATLDNIQVLYDARFGANCLPTSAIVDAGWTVSYHKGTDSYQVRTSAGIPLGFHRHRTANGAITKH